MRCTPNSALVDRVDFATRYRCLLDRLPASRLLPPRSGLERSDFVLWPNPDLPRRLLFRCFWGLSGRAAPGPFPRPYFRRVPPRLPRCDTNSRFALFGEKI